MEGREEFFRTIACFIARGFVVLSPIFSFIRSSHGKAQKIILLKDSKRESLAQKNHISLDTRNLSMVKLIH